jgi:triacylglycerol lipase
MVVGHSLGGALATIAAVDLAKKLKAEGVDINSRMALYTYGAPKIGDSEWVKYANSIMTFRIARVVHWRDPVVAVPPFGYSLTKNEGIHCYY